MRWLPVALLVSASLAGCLGGGAGEEPLQQGDEAPGDDAPPPAAVPAPPPPAPMAAAPAARAPAPLPEPVAVATDAAGDATDLNTELATRPGTKCVPLGMPVLAVCGLVEATLRGQVGPEAGVPGPAALDVLGATFQETPDTLVVRVTVAALGEDFTDAVDPDRGRGATWGACWGSHDEGRQCASLAAMPAGAGGGAAREATFTWWSGACNDWWYCSWGIAHEVAFGAPAVVTLHVPRALLPHREAGDALPLPRIVSERLDFAPDRPAWAVAGPVEAGGAVEAPWMRHHADLSPFGETFTFTTPPAPPQGSPTLAHEGIPGASSPGSPDLDILRLVLTEQPGSLTVSLELAHVDEAPEDHALSVWLGTPAGRVVDAGYTATGGVRTGHSVACADADCSELVQPGMDLLVAPGSPGWVHFTFPRGDLGAPLAGEALTLLHAATMRHAQRLALPPESPVAADLALAHEGDATGIVAPFWFRLDTRA